MMVMNQGKALFEGLPNHERIFVLEQLEDRIVLDGAIMDSDDVQDQHAESDAVDSLGWIYSGDGWWYEDNGSGWWFNQSTNWWWNQNTGWWFQNAGGFGFWYYGEHQYWANETSTGAWFWWDDVEDNKWEPAWTWFLPYDNASGAWESMWVYNDWNGSQYYKDATHYFYGDHTTGDVYKWNGSWINYGDIGVKPSAFDGEWNQLDINDRFRFDGVYGYFESSGSSYRYDFYSGFWNYYMLGEWNPIPLVYVDILGKGIPAGYYDGLFCAEQGGYLGSSLFWFSNSYDWSGSDRDIFYCVVDASQSPIFTGFMFTIYNPGSDGKWSGNRLDAVFIADDWWGSECAQTKEDVVVIDYDYEYGSVIGGAGIPGMVAHLEMISTIFDSSFDCVAVSDHGNYDLLVLSSDIIGYNNDRAMYSVSDFADEFRNWGTLMKPGGMIQLYACNVAGNDPAWCPLHPNGHDDGPKMLQAIAGYTGCSIYASTDLTGGDTGDWILEWPTPLPVSQLLLIVV